MRTEPGASLFPFAPYDEETATYTLRMEPRTSTYGSGVYEVGANGVRLFVTDTGRVFVPRGVISAENLMEVYKWGRLDAEIAAGTRKPEWEYDESGPRLAEPPEMGSSPDNQEGGDGGHGA